MVALVPDIVREIGALAGLAAFLGISLLAVVLFVQGRDVRRLRDWAGRAPERDAELQQAALTSAAERAEEIRAAGVASTAQVGPDTAEGAAVGGELPHGDPFEAESRAMELRAERQRGRGSTTYGGGGSPVSGSRAARALIGVLAVILVGGTAYAAVERFGGEDEPAGRAGARAQGENGGAEMDPGQVQVAVLNGTDASGLATAFQDGVSASGYQVGTVGNSVSTYTESRVVFEPGHRPEALSLAREFEINLVEPMDGEVESVVEGAPVAVILGDDEIPAG